MRPIDADALKQSVNECDVCNVCPERKARCSYDCEFPDYLTPKFEALIDAQPTIEPKTKVVAQVTFDEEKLREIVKKAVERFKEEYEIEPKRGEWIDDDFVGQYRCSECDYYAIDECDYCPNCGARMKGADDE